MRMSLLKTWRDFKVRKAQFSALIILVALGIASYVAFITSYNNLNASADFANEQLKLADFTVRIIGAPRGVVEKVRHVNGVRAVEGRLIVDTGLDLTEEDQAQARIIGIPADRELAVNDIILLEGSPIQKGDSRTCLLQNKFAEETGKGIGDTLTIRVSGEKKILRISGIAASPEYFFAMRQKGEIPIPKEFAVIFMEQREVEKFFGRPSTYNDFAVRVIDVADRSLVIDKVEDVLEPYRIVETVKREDQPSNFSLREEIKQNEQIANTMPTLILFISALALYIALSRLVQSQRGEIGLAKALGYSDGQILVQYLLFALFIALAGSGLGIVLGQYMAKAITQMYIDLLNIPILKHQLYPEVIIGAVVLSTVFCLLAGLVPALASARLLPVQAMRFDPNLTLTKGRVTLIERLFGWILPSTLTFRMPIRNISRARKRSAYTVIGIAFSLILTVATWSMFDSIDYMMKRQFDEIERYDMVAVFGREITNAQVLTVDKWKGVENVQPALQVPVMLEGPGTQHEGIVTAVWPDASFHGFTIIEGEDFATVFKKNGLIIPEGIAKKLEVEVGDILMADTPFIDEKEALKVMAVSDEQLGTPMFTSLEQSKKLIRSGTIVYNSLYLDVDQRWEKNVEEQLHDLPGIIQVQMISTFKAVFEDYMAFMYFFGAVLFGFAFAMAFIVIYNTFTANVIERTREIATMMTIGEDRSHLALMITLENLILAMVGIPFGIYLGIEAMSAMFESMTSEAYTLKAALYVQSYFGIIGSIMIILLLSEIPPILRIFRINLAEAIKTLD
ncbi:MAG: FtsX-like permease family protein [Actinomycetota bacterium]|nr:FtsX-like permease family protein [Actinomycetota bacterium]